VHLNCAGTAAAPGWALQWASMAAWHAMEVQASTKQSHPTPSCKAVHAEITLMLCFVVRRIYKA
jgi:hypothetical protein